MARLHEIVVDCEHAPSLAHFWTTVLDGCAIRPSDEEIAPCRARSDAGDRSGGDA
jgi:hypothetical protein